MSNDSTIIENVEKALAEENQSLEGHNLGGRYLLESVIGQGGFGRVYRARELASGQIWAVKELVFSGSRVILETLDKEQKILSWLDHPVIVTRKETISEKDRVFLVMEYVSGANLRERFEDSELSMPEVALVEMALQVLEALVYLHGQKPYPIIFSDLKPSNLMLTDSGQVKLIDFGIARLKGTEGDGQVAMGTRGYAAPEQFSGGGFDHRVDIYALGVVMHQLLSKLEPRHQRGKLPPVEHYATATDPVLAKCIARATELDPEKRYASAHHLKKEMEGLLKKWAVPRETARFALVKWAGLETRETRLSNAIEDSVQELSQAREGRANPWFVSWGIEKWAKKLSIGGGLVLLGSFFLDGIQLMDFLWIAAILVSIFVFNTMRR